MLCLPEANAIPRLAPPFAAMRALSFSKRKEPASAPQRGHPPAAGPEKRQALFESPQREGEFGFSSPTFWAQKVGKNACPPEGESRRWRDRGRPLALHALFA